LIPLDKTYVVGQTLTIKVYGNATDTIRCWLSNSDVEECSAQVNPVSFATAYDYKVTQTATHIQVKKPNWDSANFTELKITKVEITSTEAEATPTRIPDVQDSNMKWVTTWGTAEETNDFSADSAMPKIALSGSTVRQIIKVTSTGDKIKFRLSNQYGKSDVKVASMHIAKQVNADESKIYTGTDTVVTFGGKESFTIPQGQVIETDAVSFSVNALENIAISMYFTQAPTSNITGHRGARATTYQMSGNNVSKETFTSYQTTTSWFFLADASIWSPVKNKAVVCFGDSITDFLDSIISFIDVI
jgi:hypothetical protein